MNTRVIKVIDAITQSQLTIESKANTLGELKQEINNAGLSTSNRAFFEGVSKTTLMQDETQLPKTVMFKGRETTELIIMMTSVKEKIKSGNRRADLYKIIKENNLGEVLKNKYGKNYTNLSTEILEEETSHFYQGPLNPVTEDKEVSMEEYNSDKAESNVIEILEKKVKILENNLRIITDALVENEILDKNDLLRKPNIINDGNIKSSYSQEDIDEVLENMM